MAIVLTADTACVQDQEFLIVERAVWFDDECALSDADEPVLMPVDVGFDTRIGIGLVVTNVQAVNGNSNSGLADDSEIKLETAEVTLSFSGGGVSPSFFEVPLPANSIAAGSSEFVLVHVPAEVSASLRATMQGLPSTTDEHLEMEIILKGRRTGQVGKTNIGVVESRPYVYPFEICLGCLGACTAASNCGGLDTDPPVCASTDGAWTGFCGFAQWSSVFDASCDPS